MSEFLLHGLEHQPEEEYMYSLSYWKFIKLQIWRHLVKFIKVTAYYHNLWHNVEFILTGNKWTIRDIISKQDISKQKQKKNILKDFDKRMLYLKLPHFFYI
jgi:hypothetical protein